MNQGLSALSTPTLSNKRNRFTGLLIVALCVAALIVMGRSADDSHQNEITVGEQTSRSASEARDAYGRLEMSFEINRGQANDEFSFLARGAGYTIGLSPAEVVLSLARPSASQGSEVDRDHAAQSDDRRVNGTSAGPKLLRMRLREANRSAQVSSDSELPGKVNYIIGSDPSAWRTDIPTYARVRYAGVYPGVDVVYYGNQRQLEYDFVFAPGRDTAAVKLQFDGVDHIEVDATGDRGIL